MIIYKLVGSSHMNLIQIIARYFFHLILAGSLVAAPNIAVADLANGFDNALSAAERSAEDRARDAARKPKLVLEFLGIGAGMTVLDVAAGAGWYTEVLSAITEYI